MRYRELRELETLLWAYRSSRPEDSTLVPVLDRVVRAVASAAGKAQVNEPRTCGWCLGMNVGKNPHLCDRCVTERRKT